MTKNLAIALETGVVHDLDFWKEIGCDINKKAVASKNEIVSAMFPDDKRKKARKTKPIKASGGSKGPRKKVTEATHAN